MLRTVLFTVAGLIALGSATSVHADPPRKTSRTVKKTVKFPPYVVKGVVGPAVIKKGALVPAVVNKGILVPAVVKKGAVMPGPKRPTTGPTTVDPGAIPVEAIDTIDEILHPGVPVEGWIFDESAFWGFVDKHFINWQPGPDEEIEQPVEEEMFLEKKGMSSAFGGKSLGAFGGMARIIAIDKVGATGRQPEPTPWHGKMGTLDLPHRALSEDSTRMLHGALKPSRKR